MTAIHEQPPPATAPEAPAAGAVRPTGPGRVGGLDGIRGLAALFVRTRSQPWAGYALAAAVPAITVMVVNGSGWSNLNLFWLDLAWTPAIGCFLAAVGAHVRRRVRAALPAAPRVEGAPAGDVGPAPAAAASRVGCCRRSLATRYPGERPTKSSW